MQTFHQWSLLHGLVVLPLVLTALPSKAQNLIVCDQNFPSISSILQNPPGNNIIIDDRSGACSPVVSAVTTTVNVRLLLGPQSYIFSGTVTFGNIFEVEGERNFTNILVPPGAPAFRTLGSPYFALRGLTVNGNEPASSTGT